MKKKYSFLQEGPWQYSVGNAITAAAKSNAFKGAAVGTGIGSVGNIVKNSMKRDDDPTKTGVFKAAVKGAGAGAVAGGVVGSAVGHLARSNVARNAQNSLMKQGDASVKSMWQNQHLKKLIDAGIDPNTAAEQVQRLTDSGAFNANNLYKFGQKNVGTLSRFNPAYMTREAL